MKRGEAKIPQRKRNTSTFTLSTERKGTKGGRMEEKWEGRNDREILIALANHGRDEDKHNGREQEN